MSPLTKVTSSAIPEASISAAFSSLSKYIAVSYSCDGQLLSRLDVNAASAVAHVCDATSATIACVSQCASIFVNRARSHQRRADKLLEMRLEEFDAALKNLKSYLEYGSVVVLDTVDVEDSCAVVNLIVGGQLSAFPLVSTVVTVGGCGTAMHCVGHFSIVDAGVDGDRCIVSRTPFLPRGEPNTVTVVLIGVDGEPLYGVTPADMAIRVEEDAVGWSVAAVSVEANVVSIEVGLTRECNVEADLIIVIGCAALTYPLMASTSIEGTFVRTLTIRDNHGNAGLAISPDGTRLVVSNEAEHTIAVYSLPDCVFLTEFGGEGSAPGQFKYPMKICVSPLMGGNMFITDGGGNNRVQEMTLEGVHVRTIGAGVIDGGVMGIAANADALAVGLYGAVSVFDIVNGDLIRSFGVHGSEEGDMNSCFGLRFTPDGGHILIADAGNCVVSLFTLTGTFVRCIGVDAVKSPVDVDVATNGDILVVDESIHRIFVFSSDGFALLRSFGAEGETPGLFKYPAALAIHRSQLYVLDSFSARVQAFN